jgi:hypothetical protein
MNVLSKEEEEQVDKDELSFLDHRRHLQVGDDLFKPIENDDSLTNLLSCGPLVGGACSDCKFDDGIIVQTLDLVSCITNALAEVCFICKKGSSSSTKGGGGGGEKGGKGNKRTRNMKKKRSKSKTKEDQFGCFAPDVAVGMECLDPAEDFNNV